MAKQHDCLCAECELTFELPAVAQCPYCHSRQVRRLSATEKEARADADADSIRKTAKFHRDHGDLELADAWDRVADTLERKAVLS
jgi:hypothetical protein